MVMNERAGINREILDGVNSGELMKAIELIRSIEKIDWKGGEPSGRKTKDGEDIYTFPFPDYPEGVFKTLFIAGVDHDCNSNYKKFCKDVPIAEMDAFQVRTMLTWIQRGERFCDGLLAENIENGTLLALLNKLEILLSTDDEETESTVYYVDHDLYETTIVKRQHDPESVRLLMKGKPWWIIVDLNNEENRNYYLTPDKWLEPAEDYDNVQSLAAEWGMDINCLPEENEMLDRAVHFVVDKHAGQFRKGTTIPYIVHPLEVMTILNAMRAGTGLMIAGLLHDTVEDTDVSIDEIKTMFGDYVAGLVAGHTEDKSKSWRERKDTAIRELAEAGYDLKRIIMADKLSNMRNIARDYSELGEKLWERFNASKEDQSWYYSASIDALDGMQHIKETRNAYWELNSLFKDVFVKCFYDSETQTIWQKALHGETFMISRENVKWREAGRISEDAVIVPRPYAERIEDNWVEENQIRMQAYFESRQLTTYDLKKAESIDLYTPGNDIYVSMPDWDEPYYFSRSKMKWEPNDKISEYMESELMMSYLRELSAEEAINMIHSWGYTFEGEKLRSEDPDSKEKLCKADPYAPKVLSDEEISGLDPGNISAFSVAEGGAMGSPGQIIYAVSGGNRMSFFCNWNSNSLEILFPWMKQVRGWSGFGYMENVAEGWDHLDLGAGNHLFLREDVMSTLEPDLAPLRPSERYRKWRQILTEHIDSVL